MCILCHSTFNILHLNFLNSISISSITFSSSSSFFLFLFLFLFLLLRLLTVCVYSAVPCVGEIAADSFALVCVRFYPGEGKEEGEGNCNMVNRICTAALSFYLYLYLFLYPLTVPLTLPPFSFSCFILFSFI